MWNYISLWQPGFSDTVNLTPTGWVTKLIFLVQLMSASCPECTQKFIQYLIWWDVSLASISRIILPTSPIPATLFHSPLHLHPSHPIQENVSPAAKSEILSLEEISLSRCPVDGYGKIKRVWERGASSHYLLPRQARHGGENTRDEEVESFLVTPLPAFYQSWCKFEHFAVVSLSAASDNALKSDYTQESCSQLTSTAF